MRVLAGAAVLPAGVVVLLRFDGVSVVASSSYA